MANWTGYDTTVGGVGVVVDMVRADECKRKESEYQQQHTQER